MYIIIARKNVCIVHIRVNKREKKDDNKYTNKNVQNKENIIKTCSLFNLKKTVSTALKIKKD